ncbi:hypothetical protein SAMN06264365_103410 [Actinoplanes regularis]|uniref:Uncharacterized protein n=1 Tax=Actinoplanes regularis TaxID=52697 RepID=A0A238XFS4_9ACTN|nr:hypothetical protein Are01nite_32620 [Actinoplanes regularis]SNR57767.1 hypothetical protein SAMN06264365_103410 [Actinoplanes regularis]
MPRRTPAALRHRRQRRRYPAARPNGGPRPALTVNRQDVSAMHGGYRLIRVQGETPVYAYSDAA